MKRILNIVVIFLFAATATSYAGFFKDQPETNNSSGNSGSHSNSRISHTGETNSENYSGFFGSPSGADPLDPGGRPESGDGIGQDAPLGDGLSVLFVCCVALVLVKIYRHKRSS